MGQIFTGLGLPLPGGGGGRQTFDAGTFADLAALNVWGAANLSSLFNSETQVTVASIGRDVYEWSGSDTPTSYPTGGSWTLRSIAGNQGPAGPEGPDGPPGADGTMLEFGSNADRDAFFSTRLDLLSANLPIQVTVAVETVSSQVWTGQTNPATYDAILWRVASIRSGTASFELDEIHTFSSGGRQVFVTNEATGLSFFTAQQFVGDHENPARRFVSNTPTVRNYSGDITAAPPGVEPGGPVAATGATPFDVDFTVLGSDTSLFGITYVPAESYTGRLQYAITERDSGNLIEEFTQTLDVVLLDGVPFTQWFKIPLELLLGDNVTATLTKNDGTILDVRPEAGNANRPYTTSFLRFFTRPALVVSDQAAAQLQPIIVGGAGINVDVSGNVMTVSRGGGNGGGTNPPAEGDVLYHGRSTVSDAATVDVSTLTVNVTDYNRQLAGPSNTTQTVFYETNPNTPSGGVKASKPINETTGDRARRKLLYIPEGTTIGAD